MNSKMNKTEIDIDYFTFDKGEFYEWVATAPISNLVDALLSYFEVLKFGIDSIDKDADFTDPTFLDELNGIAWVSSSMGRISWKSKIS
jgi:hypothetical protein